MSNQIDFYESNAESYIRSSLEIDVSGLYDAFLKHLPSHGKILDVGCGAGRDAKYFADKEFNVTAFDASNALVNHAKMYCGGRVNVQMNTFEDFDTLIQFDAIWACASLVHLSLDDLKVYLRKFSRYLTMGGVFYFSLKCFEEGITTYTDKSGRCFFNHKQVNVEFF